jgi:hypothetical protein
MKRSWSRGIENQGMLKKCASFYKRKSEFLSLLEEKEMERR